MTSIGSGQLLRSEPQALKEAGELAEGALDPERLGMVVADQ